MPGENIEISRGEERRRFGHGKRKGVATAPGLIASAIVLALPGAGRKEWSP